MFLSVIAFWECFASLPSQANRTAQHPWNRLCNGSAKGLFSRSRKRPRKRARNSCRSCSATGHAPVARAGHPRRNPPCRHHCPPCRRHCPPSRRRWSLCHRGNRDARGGNTNTIPASSPRNCDRCEVPSAEHLCGQVSFLVLGGSVRTALILQLFNGFLFVCYLLHYTFPFSSPCVCVRNRLAHKLPCMPYQSRNAHSS